MLLVLGFVACSGFSLSTPESEAVLERVVERRGAWGHKCDSQAGCQSQQYCDSGGVCFDCDHWFEGDCVEQDDCEGICTASCNNLAETIPSSTAGDCTGDNCLFALGEECVDGMEHGSTCMVSCQLDSENAYEVYCSNGEVRLPAGTDEMVAACFEQSSVAAMSVDGACLSPSGSIPFTANANGDCESEGGCYFQASDSCPEAFLLSGGSCEAVCMEDEALSFKATCVDGSMEIDLSDDEDPLNDCLMASMGRR